MYIGSTNSLGQGTEINVMLLKIRVKPFPVRQIWNRHELNKSCNNYLGKLRFPYNIECEYEKCEMSKADSQYEAFHEEQSKI